MNLMTGVSAKEKLMTKYTIGKKINITASLAESKLKRWHGLFQDIEFEHDFQPLEIEGKIPKDIQGTLFQNGPGLFGSKDERYGHVFDSDGLIRGVRITEGKAWGAARLVQTEALVKERKANRMLYTGIGTDAKGLEPFKEKIKQMRQGKSLAKNNANVSVLMWQKRLLALNEASLPTEINPETLETLGETSLGGIIKGGFCAHPHWVSENQCGYSFGVNTESINTYLEVYELPKTEPCKKISRIKLDSRPVGYMHDFIATPNYLVFFIPPVHLPLYRWPEFMMGKAIYPLIEWREKLGTEIIILPLNDLDNPIRFKTDPFFQVHFSNAYEVGEQEIIVDYLSSPDLYPYYMVDRWSKGHSSRSIAEDQVNRKAESSVLKRATINLTTKSFSSEVLWNEFCEFPKIHPAHQGSKHQYVYMLTNFDSHSAFSPMFSHIMKLDVDSGRSSHVSLGDEQFPLEPIFIRKNDSEKEDEGYLLSMTYDGNNNKSYLAIIDAQNLEAGPLAKIHFSQALPISFHGIWCPE